MKLTVLFAQYLYQHKVLNLPGIGIFTIDPSVTIPDSIDKNSDFIQHIHYEQKPVSKPDDSFIDYIRTQTGKIRPLAESDLDSFLSDGKILLNIGKPFYFEGIGSLQKNRAGKYEFIPGQPLTDRLEKYTREKKSEQHDEWNSTSEPVSEGIDSRKIFIVSAIVIGLIAIIGGGYYLYQRNLPENETQYGLAETNTDTSVNIADTSKVFSDTAVNLQASANAVIPSSPGTYRFIIETTPNKTRALKRYNQLKSYLLDIKLDALADSALFKLYFEIPATTADTSKIKDSLKRMYNTRNIIIE